jgi:hypothetical protein
LAWLRLFSSEYAEIEQPQLSPWLYQAFLRLDALRFAPVLRPLVLRAAPRADAALRVVVFRFLAPPFLFFDVSGMLNDSSYVWGSATRWPQNTENMEELFLTMQYL